MLPVNPVTLIWMGLLVSFGGIAGLVTASGHWRLLFGVILLAGIAEVVHGIVWARSWYVREVRDTTQRLGDRRGEGWDDAWDDGRKDGWDPGRTRPE